MNSLQIKRILAQAIPEYKFSVRKHAQGINFTPGFDVVCKSDTVRNVSSISARVSAALKPYQTCSLSESERFYNFQTDALYSNYNSYNFHWFFSMG